MEHGRSLTACNALLLRKKAVFCTQLPEKQKCVRNKPGKAHLAGWVKAVYNKHENVYT
jgi:hypothetical protein